MNATLATTEKVAFCSIYKVGGIATFLLIFYSLTTMIILSVVGGPPSTASEAFFMLQGNRILGLLRMDVLTIVFIPLYYLVFLSIYMALDNRNDPWSIVALILVLVGVTLFLATPSVFSMVNLSDKYAAATSENERIQFLAAGEAVLATDMWHGTGALIGGVLIQVGAILFSILMLHGKVFSKRTAYVGIVTHGLDLGHFFFLFSIPPLGVVLLAIAGALYLWWFPLIGWRLIQIGNQRRDGMPE